MDRARVSAADGSRWRDSAWEEAFALDASRTGVRAAWTARRATGAPEGPAPDPAARPAGNPTEPAPDPAARPAGNSTEPAPDPATRPVPASSDHLAAGHAGAGFPGRRTIKIQGRGAERDLFLATYQSRRRPSEPWHRRAGFKPDRVAMWAVVLCILLALVAAASAHAAVGGHVALKLSPAGGTPGALRSS